MKSKRYMYLLYPVDLTLLKNDVTSYRYKYNNPNKLIGVFTSKNRALKFAE